MQKKPARTKRPKQVRTPRQRLLHILFIVATVLAAIVVAVFIGWNLFAKEPERPVYTPRPQASANQGETGETENSGEAPGQISGDRKDDFWTFLLVGQDTFGGGNTDTMMLVSYDIPNQKLSVLSLPRDTMVNVSWDIKRLNSVYNYAPYYDKEGMEFLKEEIAQLVGYEPDFTVTIQWDAVGELVDAIGGVYFEVPFDMYYNDLSQNFKIDLKAGYQKLDGDQAMQLIRYRHNSIGDTGRIDSSYGYANGDLGRIETQQAFLKAVIQQCLQLKNVTKINALAKVFTENVETELTIGNLAWFAQQAIFGGLDMDSVSFFTMPNTGASVYSRTYGNYQSYVTPNADELVALVNEYFNPYKDDLQKSELDIMYVNRDGTIGCTGSALADTRHNAIVTARNSEPAESTAPAETPAESPKPSESPIVSESPAPGMTPTPEETSAPAPSPGQSQNPEHTPTPSPTPQGGASPSPTPAVTPEPVPDPVPTPTPTPADPVPTSGPGMEPTE